MAIRASKSDQKASLGQVDFSSCQFFKPPHKSEVGNNALGFPVTITRRLDFLHLALAAIDLAWTRVALRFLIRQTPPFRRLGQGTLGGRAQDFLFCRHLIGHRIALA